MKCLYCTALCKKKGWYKLIQRYQCLVCNKYQRAIYIKPIISDGKKEQVKALSNEGLGNSAISRLLKISKSSVQRTLLALSRQVLKPIIIEENQQYEIDELRTYISNKKNECWIIYALNKNTKQIIDFVVGRRTKANINKVVESLKKLNPTKIYSDKLNTYQSIIPKAIHNTIQYNINHIERKNLDLRTHIKSLGRKTICYAKSQDVLSAILQLYFYGKNPNYSYRLKYS